MWFLQADGFDWDQANRLKCQKHGVSTEEIETLLRGRFDIYVDPASSLTEQRLRAIGRTGAGRWVFIVFTIREKQGQTFVRPISARYMHRREVDHYASQTRS